MLARSCAGAKTSTCGNAACMPAVSGWYVGLPSNGFSRDDPAGAPVQIAQG